MLEKEEVRTIVGEGKPVPLRYFFTAFYADNTYLNQNPEDISTRDPQRSAFYDVDHERLTAFSLADAEHVYVVDLLTGTFIIDGVPFRMHAEEEAQPPFKLIFARRHTHTIGSRDLKELSHNVVYRLGWQARNMRGDKVERVMEID